MGVLEGLKPERVFYYFEEICKIPHGSRNTAAISEFICTFAENMGLKYIRDEVGNVIVFKTASKGCETADTVIFQGHLDMVCEKTSDSSFDFKNSGLRLNIIDDYIYAKNTTLGGDDGIAVAIMLALLEDDKLVAPALECIFTVDEEIGMIGALALDTSSLTGKTLINLDSEEEGIFLTSCAGGVSCNCEVPIRYKEKEGELYKLVVCGFKGGHSGTDIDKNRGNANIIMGRLLHYLRDNVKFSICSISGGFQDNAICRENSAEIIVQSDDCSNFEDIIDAFEETIRNEFRATEDNIQIYCEDLMRCSRPALTNKTQERVIFLLNTVPDGIQRMSPEIDGLVQTSLNLGMMRLTNEKFSITFAVRSSIRSEKKALCAKLRYLTETIGGVYTESGEYPAWEYKASSKIRPIMIDLYKNMTGKEPKVEGIHAGLECGVFSSAIPDIDIISMGPDILDIHSPKERLSISSTQRTYELVVKALGELAK